MTDALPVSARGLVKHYGDLVAVDHVDLTVERGDVFGYLGPNGAGKTTSLRMLLGLIRPTAGSARLFGPDPLEDGAKALEGVAGFVEGPRFYPYLTGRQNLVMIGRLSGLRRRQARARAASRAPLRRVMWVRSGVGGRDGERRSRQSQLPRLPLHGPASQSSKRAVPCRTGGLRLSRAVTGVQVEHHRGAVPR